MFAYQEFERKSLQKAVYEIIVTIIFIIPSSWKGKKLYVKVEQHVKFSLMHLKNRNLNCKTPEKQKLKLSLLLFTNYNIIISWHLKNVDRQHLQSRNEIGDLSHQTRTSKF